MLDVVARVALEPRRSLYVVAVANKTLLVGTSEMGLSVLTELDGTAVKAHETPTPGFGAFVRAALSRRRAVAPSDADPLPASGGESATTVGDLTRRTPSSRASDGSYTEPRIELATKAP